MKTIPLSEKKKLSNARYDAKATQFIGLKLNIKTDADILDALEGKAKQTEIKRLVRLGLEAEKHK